MLKQKAHSVKISDMTPGKQKYRKLLKAAIRARKNCNRVVRKKGKDCKAEFIANKQIERE